MGKLNVVKFKHELRWSTPVYACSQFWKDKETRIVERFTHLKPFFKRFGMPQVWKCTYFEALVSLGESAGLGTVLAMFPKLPQHELQQILYEKRDRYELRALR